MLFHILSCTEIQDICKSFSFVPPSLRVLRQADTFLELTLGLNMQTDPGHDLKFYPSEKHPDCFTGQPGLQSILADALTTEAERIKSIYLRPGKKRYYQEHHVLRNQSHKAAAKKTTKPIRGVRGARELNHGHPWVRGAEETRGQQKRLLHHQLASRDPGAQHCPAPWALATALQSTPRRRLKRVCLTLHSHPADSLSATSHFGD